MSKQGVAAVLLPGTSLYSKIKYADAAPFREAGCSIALATDYNPGSCQLDNLPFIASLEPYIADSGLQKPLLQ